MCECSISRPCPSAQGTLCQGASSEGMHLQTWYALLLPLQETHQLRFKASGAAACWCGATPHVVLKHCVVGAMHAAGSWCCMAQPGIQGT
jgi:hypothetical protein